MRLSFLIAASFLAAIAPASAGEIKTYDLTGFDQIIASAGISVEVTAGPKYSVSAEILQGSAERVQIEMSGTKLIVSHKNDMGLKRQPRQETRVRITVPSLTAVKASSGSSMSVSGLKAGSFAASASSGGSMEVSGTCDALTVSVSSGGSANLKDMACKSVTASASSGGAADATATQSATSTASSGGSVDIWGNPASRKANKSMSGGSTTFH
jgi:hypothetical protein